MESSELIQERYTTQAVRARNWESGPQTEFRGSRGSAAEEKDEDSLRVK